MTGTHQILNSLDVTAEDGSTHTFQIVRKPNREDAAFVVITASDKSVLGYFGTQQQAETYITGPLTSFLQG